MEKGVRLNPELDCDRKAKLLVTWITHDGIVTT
jgi:hypothetical protein